MVRSILVIFLLVLCPMRGLAEDLNHPKPSYVACLKAIHHLDFISREHLSIACVTIAERFCLAPIRTADADLCFFASAKEAKDYRFRLFALLPHTVGDEVSTFHRNSYQRALKRLADEARQTKCYEGLSAGGCAFVEQVFELNTAVRAARIAGVSLP